MEVDSRRRLPLPGIPNNLLRRLGSRQPTYRVDVLPSRPGAVGTYFNHAKRIPPGRRRRPVLPDIRRGWVHCHPHVQKNGRQELGEMHLAHGGNFPGTDRPGLHVGEFVGHCAWFHERLAVHGDPHHHRAVHALGIPIDRVRRHLGQELREPRIQRTDTDDEGGARNPNRDSMVQRPAIPSPHRGFPALLRHLHRAALHLRVHLGTSDLHVIRNPDAGIHPPHHRDLLHHGRAAVLPTRPRGSPLVVGSLRQRRHDGIVHLPVLLLLLLPPQRNERPVANILLLWIHGRRVVRLLPHARKRRIPIQPAFRQVHLFQSQMRLGAVALHCIELHFFRQGLWRK
mmetsp:Transcript_22421/g.63544  ORF Transcript_22421/g.63544 Transcript_22421/m.63544 type:complete len:341 (+) Transcript_22421:993-2015(+)